MSRKLFEKVVICIKTPGFIRFQNRSRMTVEEVKLSLIAQHRDPQRTFESGRRQMEAAERLFKAFPRATWIDYGSMTPESVADADLVIAFGGDEHFKYVASFIRGLVPILGINSEPQLSSGALTIYRSDEVDVVARFVATGELEFEHWPRIAVYAGDRLLGIASTEVGFYERDRDLTSRHVLSFNGAEQRFGFSDFLVYNGASSTGWPKWIGRYRLEDGTVGFSLPPYPHELNELRWAHNSASPSRSDSGDLERGRICPAETLTIISQNDEDGVISFDPGTNLRVPFPAGMRVEVRIADVPLRVVKRSTPASVVQSICPEAFKLRASPIILQLFAPLSLSPAARQDRHPWQ